MFSGGTESTQSTEWFEVSVVTSSTTCVVIQATINTVLITPATVGTQLFHWVKIEGAEMTMYPGRPSLPIIPLIVAVDHEREVILSVEATGATTETQVLAMPAQHTDSFMHLRPVPFLQDEDIYWEDEDYPGTTAVISAPYVMGGLRCVHLDFLPVQQNPSDAAITAYNSITITITYGTISTINTLDEAPEQVDAMLAGYLQEGIINYGALGVESGLPQGKRLLAIIAGDYWDNAELHNLLDWHEYDQQ